MTRPSDPTRPGGPEEREIARARDEERAAPKASALRVDGEWSEPVPVLRGGWRALGRDPFAETVGTRPFLERMAPRAPVARRRESAPAVETPAPAGSRPIAPPRSPPLPRVRPPRLSEVEAPEGLRGLERLLDDEDRRRIAALARAMDGEEAYDRFGLSVRTVRSAFPWFYALYRLWFRVRSQGHANLPPEGAAVLAANHGGLLPFDGAMTVMDVLLHTDPPRLPRAIVERWAGSLPFVNVFFARVGQVVGTRENFADLLGEDQLVLVFPEGIAGIRKTIAHRYRLQSFHVGFVEEALRSGVPIVPVAVVGAEDQSPILFDLKPLARRLGLPAAPITPTFPWLGPAGLLPYPVQYRIVYGEPIDVHERFGPEAADDARLVRYLANQVRREVQKLVDRHRG